MEDAVVQRLIHTLGACLLLLALAACGSKVNQANFDKIKSGMTEQEVLDILGKPDETQSRLGDDTWKRWDWKDDKTGGKILIQFIGGRVVIPYYDKG